VYSKNQTGIAYVMNLGTESSNQQFKKNQIVFLDKARIALDALQNEDKTKVIHAINCL
jgi:hypothetical protein